MISILPRPGNEQISIHIANLFTALCAYPEGRERLSLLGALRALTKLLSNDHTQLRSAVSRTHETLRQADPDDDDGDLDQVEAVSASAQMSAQDIEKCLNVIKEIVETEKTYVEQLLTMATLFLNPLSSTELSSADELHRIFSTTEPLSRLHTVFLQQLEKRTLTAEPNKPVPVGDLFLSLAGSLQPYESYINNYPDASRSLAKAMRRSAFRSFVTSQLSELKMKTTSIDNCLITPIQRIPRYKMLLQDLLSHMSASNPDYGPLSQALLQIQEMADYLELKNRVFSTQRVLRRIESNFELLPSHVERILELQSDDLSTFEDADKGVPAELWLFTDCVMYVHKLNSSNSSGQHESVSSSSNPASDDRLPPQYRLVTLLPLFGLTVTDAGMIEDRQRSCHAFQLSYYEQELLVFSLVKVNKDNFLKGVRKAQQAITKFWRNESNDIKKIVKVYLEENASLERVGLNNTHRTLVIQSLTNARDMRKDMIKKMGKAMNQMQMQIVSEECVDRRIHLRLLLSSDSKKAKHRRYMERVLQPTEPVQPYFSVFAPKDVEFWFLPYPPRTHYFDSNHMDDDDDDISMDDGIENKGMIRVYLPDNIFLRQLGLHNSFKTLMITSQTSVQQTEALTIKKLLGGIQGTKGIDTAQEQCKHYSLHWGIEGSRDVHRLNPLDKPWLLHKKMTVRQKLSKGGEKFYFTLLPVGQPHFKKSSEQLVLSDNDDTTANIGDDTVVVVNYDGALTVIDDDDDGAAASSSSTSSSIIERRPDGRVVVRRKKRDQAFDLLTKKAPPTATTTSCPAIIPSGIEQKDAHFQKEQAIIFPSYQQTNHEVPAEFQEKIVIRIALSPTWILRFVCPIDATIAYCRTQLILRLDELSSQYVYSELKQSIDLKSQKPLLMDATGAELFDDDLLVDVCDNDEHLLVKFGSQVDH